MNKEQMEQAIEELTDEQREALYSWLSRGEGHSVMEIDYFTDMGLPAEWLEPMVDRRWSNFVQIPEGITKVAEDTVSSVPIGWLAGDDDDDTGRWVVLLTPKEQQNGYLDTYWSTSILSSRIVTKFIEGDEVYFDEYDTEEVERFKRDYNLHPKAQYWSHRYDEEYECNTIEFKVPLAPKTNYQGEEFTQDIDKRQNIFLVKYDGTKRIDYINANKVAWHYKQASRKPITHTQAQSFVREKLRESPHISALMGSVDLEFRDENNKRRRLKDIARDYWQQDKDDIAWHQSMLDEALERESGILRFIENTKNVPSGWVKEHLEPLGYTDCMWNNNFFVPWVDGIGSTSVISALARTLDIDLDGIATLGRGSTARAYGERVLQTIKAE
ncbi:MAG: hypothetical protein VW270_19485 [Candidatus Poseidoniales archaeon]